MTRITEYRQAAAHARDQARLAGSDADRRSLLFAAVVFDGLADDLVASGFEAAVRGTADPAGQRKAS